MFEGRIVGIVNRGEATPEEFGFVDGGCHERKVVRSILGARPW